jgi:outer membrane protein
MKNPIRLLAALALVLAAPAARAQNKIGFVNLQRALEEVEEGKAAKAALKKDFDEKQRQLDARRTDFEKLRADFEKQAPLMNEAARKDKAAEVEKKAGELQQVFVQWQKDLQQREAEVMRGMFDKLSVLVREIAEADGFTMVLGENAVAYAQPSLDLTNELVRKYNARHPGGAAGAKKPEARKPDAKPASAPAAAPAAGKK